VDNWAFMDNCVEVYFGSPGYLAPFADDWQDRTLCAAALRT